MNFDQLKQEAGAAFSALAKESVAAKKKLALIETHLADALSRRTRLEAQKVKLTQSADSSVGDSVNSFEQFQTSLRKINSQILALGEASEVLKTKIVPGERGKVSECAKKLQAAILEFWKPRQKTIEGEMRELLDQIIRLRDDFETAFISTADDSGLVGSLFLGMYQVYGNCLPIPRHARFGDIMLKPPPPAEQTPPEPTQDTPEQPEQTELPVQDTVLEALLTPEPEPAQARTVLGGAV